MVEEKNIYGDGDNDGRRDEVPDDNQVDKNEKDERESSRHQTRQSPL